MKLKQKRIRISFLDNSGVTHGRYVKADVYDAFGVHRFDEIEGEYWYVAHLPTGRKMGFAQRKDWAISLAKRLATIPNTNTGEFNKPETMDSDAVLRIRMVLYRRELKRRRR